MRLGAKRLKWFLALCTGAFFLTLGGCGCGASDDSASITDAVAQAPAEGQLLPTPSPELPEPAPAEPEPSEPDRSEPEPAEPEPSEPEPGLPPSEPEPDDVESAQTIALTRDQIQENRIDDPGTFDPAPFIFGCGDGTLQGEQIAEPVLGADGLRHTFCVTSGTVSFIEVWDPGGTPYVTEYTSSLRSVAFTLGDPRGTYKFRVTTRRGASDGSISVGLPLSLTLESDVRSSEPTLLISGYGEETRLRLSARIEDLNTGDWIFGRLATVDLDPSGLTSVPIRADAAEFCIYPDLGSRPINRAASACFGFEAAIELPYLYRGEIDDDFTVALGEDRRQAVGGEPIGSTDDFDLYAANVFTPDIEPDGFAIFTVSPDGKVSNVYRDMNLELDTSFTKGCAWIEQTYDLNGPACPAPDERWAVLPDQTIDLGEYTFDLRDPEFEQPFQIYQLPADDLSDLLAPYLAEQLTSDWESLVLDE